MIVRGESKVELDGWLAGFAVGRARVATSCSAVRGLAWFRSPRG